LEDLYQIYQKHPVVCTDTREITKGCLFFALKGERFDGNDFALEALKSGAAYAIVDNPELPKKATLIQVPNVLAALQTLATTHRRALNIPILAITGTNGKTTTKELISCVLSKRYAVSATQGNFNNHIGVPLTLLRMNADTKFGVVEMGANHLGEIATLCAIAEPTCGLITNIGRAHLEGFGSLEGVQKTKGELYDYLAANDNTVFCNTDNAMLAAMAGGRKFKKIVRYGQKKNNVRILSVTKHFPFLRLTIPTYPEIETYLIGAYNADNVLAAVTIGEHFGIKKEEIVEAISNYLPTNNRSQLIRSERNTIIMDAYNANPSSMSAAIENFAQIKEPNKWVILGDMKELGEESATEHSAIMDLLYKKWLKNMLLVGENFTQAATHENHICFDSTDTLIEYLKENPLSEATVLIKGSHSMGLDKLEKYL